MTIHHLVVVAGAIGLMCGCVPGPGNVVVRADGTPGPEPCPKEAVKAMQLIRLHTGESAWIDLDMNHVDERNLVVHDGPIESGLSEPLGNAFETRTRFYGKVWTSGPYVVIRYYEAKPLDLGPPVPICAVARLDEGQLRKRPGPVPGSATLDYSAARVVIVDDFR